MWQKVAKAKARAGTKFSKMGTHTEEIAIPNSNSYYKVKLLQTFLWNYNLISTYIYFSVKIFVVSELIVLR